MNAIDTASLHSDVSSHFAHGKPAASARYEIVFVDLDANDQQALVESLRTRGGIQRQLEVVFLEADRDGMEQITATLADRADVDAVHIVSHGTTGAVRLGDNTLTATNLDDYTDQVRSWGRALTEHADVLFYGCDLAATDTGRDLMERIAEACGCDVAASDDLTGHASLSGDWDLEFATGAIEASVIVDAELAGSWLVRLDTVSGLLAHWTFDSIAGADDSSGNGYDGTLAGGANIDTAGATNQIGNGKLSLDGTGDYVELSPQAGNFAGLGEGTVSAWVNFTSAALGIIADLANTSASDYFSFYVNSGQVYWGIWAGGAAQVRANSAVTINDGAWHHLAVTVDAGGNRLFIDGVELTGAAVTHSAGSAANTIFLDDLAGHDDFQIGAYAGPGGEFNGLIDDVRIYDRALSASDVSELATRSTTPQTVTVTTTNDLANGNTLSIATLLADDGGDGISLREAIAAVNNTTTGSNPHEIHFNLPLLDSGRVYYQDDTVGGSLSAGSVVSTTLPDGSIGDFDPDYPAGGFGWWRIQPTSALPQVTAAVVIDASTQPGFTSHPLIEIDGGLAGNANGLYLTGGGTTVRGLAINRFSGPVPFGSAIRIDGGSGGNTVVGNYLGTDITGTQARGNVDNGLIIAGSNNDVVGGATAADRNITSGNENGIFLFNVDGTVITGNYIGVDATGTRALGNTTTGVWGGLTAARNVRVGGAAAGEGNVISANSDYNVRFDFAGTTGNQIVGNYIGTNAAGTAGIGSTTAGVYFADNADGNRVGGIGSGEGNLIAHHTQQGVLLAADAGVNNAVLSNMLYSNGALGVDLADDGVTYNDAEDADTGPNEKLNFPVLTNVVQDGVDLDIGFSVDLPVGWYRVEFFENPGGNDDTGFGEGEVYLGSATINASGVAGYEAFSATLTGVTPAQILGMTATATQDTSGGAGTTFGSTSEFGPAYLGAGVVEVTTTSDAADGDTSSIAALLGNPGADGAVSLREAIDAANNTVNGGSLDEIRFNIAGAGPHFINTTSALPSITDSVVIDATTEPDFATNGNKPIVVIDGGVAGAGVDGLVLTATADGSTIQGLVIREFAGPGITIQVGSDGNFIYGNYLGGLDTDGEFAGAGERNQDDGIYLLGNANTIGGSAPGQGNVISGNAEGVHVEGANNVLRGNYIGTNATGTAAVANTGIGVEVLNASGTNIGGAAANEGNVISGNLNAGIVINGEASDNTLIKGNIIGLNAAGNAAIANMFEGIYIHNGADGTVIGGATAGERNIISGNSADGINIADATTTGSIIQGNYIGTDATGSTALANIGDGIELNGITTGHVIGGSISGERNLVSGNTGDGVFLTSSSNVSLRGNYIGTNAAGTAAIANGDDGVMIDSASSLITVGGSTLGEGNLVSGNAGDGIRIHGDGNTLYGNYFGTNAAGAAAIPNGDEGVDLFSSDNNIVGGSGANEGNLISGNAQNGMQVFGANSSTIQGNLIGTQVDGITALANGSNGIWFAGSASNNLVGGTDPNAGNVIAHNNGDGVTFLNDGNDANSVIGNLIFSNTGAGIDLNDDGVTLNDADDTDTIANEGQNYPVFTQASLSGTDLTVSGTLDTDGTLTQYRIEFFGNASSTQDATHGEGAVSLGTTTVTTDGSGDASFTSVTLSGVSLSPSDYVTATATKIENPAQVGVDDLLAYGDTSEFALNVAAAFTNTAPFFGSGGGVLTTDISTTNNNGEAVAVQPDGKILVTGVSGSNFTVVRYNTDGTLDTGFGGGDGIATASFGAGTERAKDVLVQSDGKILVAGWAYTAASGNLDFGLARFNSDGSLDTGFGGGDGMASLDFDGFNDYAEAVTLQSDGKIVVAGRSRDGVNDRIAVARFNADGSVDTSFSSDGKEVLDFAPQLDVAYGVEVQSDGKIVVGGYSWDTVGSQYLFTLLRYDTGGTLDTTYDGDGISRFAVGANSNFAFDMTLQDDDKALIAGHYYNGSDYDFALARVGTDGSLDTSFDGDGLVTTAIGAGDDRGYGVAVQSDGKILLSGYTHNGADEDFAVVRYHTDGSLDTGFDGDGIVTTDLGGGDDAALAVTVDAAGNVLAVGDSFNGGDDDFALVRYHAEGALDGSFALESLLDGAPAFTEGGPAVVLDGDAAAGDLELDALNGGLGNYDGASLSLQRNGGADADDVFSFNDGNGITQVGGNLIKNSQIIAAFDTTTTPGALAIALTDTNGETPTSADLASILSQITYANAGDAPPASVQIDWTLDDGDAGVALQVVGSTTVTISAVNDAPVFVNLDGNPAFVEDGAAVVLDGDVTFFDAEIDAGIDNYAGVDVFLSRNGGADADDEFVATGNLDPLTEGGALVLSGVNIGDVLTNSSGTLNVRFTGSGTATKARVDEFLQSIGYRNASDTPPSSVQIDWQMEDGNGGAQGSGGNLYANGSTTVTVSAVNDAPVFLNLDDTPTFVQGGPAVVFDADVSYSDAELAASLDSFLDVELTLARNGGANADDTYEATGNLDPLTEAGSLVLSSVTIGTVVTNSGGTLTLRFTAAADFAAANETLRSIAYRNTSGAPPASVLIDWQMNDGNGGMAPQGSGGNLSAFGDVTVNIAASSPPVVTLPTPNQTYTEGSPGEIITPDATVTDVDSPDFDGATLTVALVAGAAAGDRLSLLAGGSPLVRTVFESGGSNTVAVSHNGTVVGRLSGGIDENTPLVVTFDADADAAVVQAVLRQLVFQNTSDDPSTANRTIDITLTDGDGGTSAAQSVTMAVTPVNDTPRVATVIETEDFEGGATGWNDNTTTNNAVLSEFLGRFNAGNGPAIVEKTFAVPAGTTQTIVTLDFYEIDSWDSEAFEIYVDNVLVAAPVFVAYNNDGSTSGTTGNVAWSVTSIDPGTTDQAFVGRFTDQAHRVELIVTSPGPTLKIGFSSDMNGVLLGDESWGIDNLMLRHFGSTHAYTEGDGASAFLLAALSVTDADDTDLESATLQITSNYVTGEDTLAFTDQNGISGSWNATTGTLTLTGTASVAFYRAAIQSVTYINASDTPNTADRTVTVIVDDGFSLSNPLTATVSVTATNDEQVLVTNAGATVDEGSMGNTITTAILETTDADHTTNQLVYTLTDVTDNGALRLNGTVLGLNNTFTQDDIDNNRVTYDHNGSETVNDFFDFDVGDGVGSLSSGTFSLTVTPQNDAPTLTGNTLTVTEGQSVVLTVGNVSATDVDDPPATLTYFVNSLTGGRFELVSTPGVSIGGFTQAQVNAAQVRFVHDGDEAAPAYNLTVSDGALSDGPNTVTVTFTNVNDAPAIATNQLVLTAGQSVILDASSANTADPDNTSSQLTYTATSVMAGRFEMVGAPGVTVTSFTQAQINAGQLVFIHDGTTNAPSYGLAVTDGALSDGPAAAQIFFNTNILDPTIDDIPTLPAEAETDPTGAPPDPPAFEPGPGVGGDETGPTPVATPPSPPDLPAASGPPVAEPSVEPTPSAKNPPTETAVDPGTTNPEPESTPATEPEPATHQEAVSPTDTGSRTPEASAKPSPASRTPRTVDQWSTREVKPMVNTGMTAALSDVSEQFGSYAEAQDRDTRLVVGNAVMVSGLVTIGYVVWLFRGASILAGVLTSLPVWKMIDPLAVLPSPQPGRKRWWRRRKAETSVTKTEIESMFGG
ncbi:MAG: cadherin-like domain-containing protein [Planctomycetota bacterium]